MANLITRSGTRLTHLTDDSKNEVGYRTRCKRTITDFHAQLDVNGGEHCSKCGPEADFEAAAEEARKTFLAAKEAANARIRESVARQQERIAHQKSVAQNLANALGLIPGVSVEVDEEPAGANLVLTFGGSTFEVRGR